MEISNNLSVSGIDLIDRINNDAITTKNNETSAVFDGLYSASINMFDEVNDMQKIANQEQIDYLTGKTDNMLGVIMAQERALSSLNFTVQVTNKMVDVYKQIMQIQI